MKRAHTVVRGWLGKDEFSAPGWRYDTSNQYLWKSGLVVGDHNRYNKIRMRNVQRSVSVSVLRALRIKPPVLLNLLLDDLLILYTIRCCALSIRRIGGTDNIIPRLEGCDFSKGTFGDRRHTLGI